MCAAEHPAADSILFPTHRFRLVTPRWTFNRVDPRFKNREATQGEFFAADTDLRAFVRESIQNSLDAKRPDTDGPVGVRMFLSGETYGLSPNTAKPYFKAGWKHYRAARNGLRDAPDRDETLRYFVYEDSGTTGLTGDVEQFHEVPGVRNPFYYFFRAEGQSNKSETDRGRWGLGKFVFPRCSRIRSFFALTVRHDDERRLLVGQSILRSHRVKDRNYTPDGWFGERTSGNKIPLPVEDDDFIEQFAEDFCLERGNDPGLSIVVPFCDPDWTADQLTQCVAMDYFFPILNNELVVTIEGPGSQFVLSAHSLPDVVATFPAHVQAHILPLLELSTWGMDQQATGMPKAEFHSRTSAPRWTQKLLPEDLLDRLRQEFSASRRIALRIPVIVRPRPNPNDEPSTQQPSGGLFDGVPVQPAKSPDLATHFDIFLEKADGSDLKRPLFIREGILVSDVRSRLTRDVRAIVCINDAPLARFLGDAENPAHTDWSHTSTHFRGRYINGEATLRFVRNAVAELCQLLARDPSEEDPRLLLDVFSLAADTDSQGYLVDYEMLKSAQEKARKTTPRDLKSKARPRPFRVRRRKGGFRVFYGDRRAECPTAIDVKVAYDRRNGNPLRRYSEADFQFGDAQLEITNHSARVEVLSGNEIRLHIEDQDFDIAVTGFDANRDLYLDVRLTQAETS